jgi:hypothetical protein
MVSGVDSRYVCSFTAFPVGGPNKDVHYTPLGFRGKCPLRGLWLLTHQIANIIIILQSFRWKNLDLEAVNWRTVAKGGVAPLCPPYQQMHNISRRPNPLSCI